MSGPVTLVAGDDWPELEAWLAEEAAMEDLAAEAVRRPSGRAEDGHVDLFVLLVAVALLAGAGGVLGLLAGAGVPALLLAAVAPWAIVVGVVMTRRDDRARNRVSAAAWERDRQAAAKVGGSPEVPARTAAAVTAPDEAEHLADAGAVTMGLTIAAGAVVSLLLSGLLLYAGTRTPGPECQRYRDGGEAPILTMVDGSIIALSGGC